MKPILRFAPSPTGLLSFGNARTALFNYVYAKANGGKFLLRIEDTDEARSKKELEQPIYDGLTWLCMQWDNKEIPRQSERTEVYKKYLEKLINEDKAYFCFCSSENLDKDKEAQTAEGLPPIYRGPCKNLNKQTALSKSGTEKHVIRFRMPEKEISIPDLVRGDVRSDLRLIGDIIIAKNLQSPLYNFAVVIDDFEFQITHVIRGEDHLSNTPKQWAIAESLEIPHPVYGHLPVILGPDKKKLSKRYLQGALKDYENKGYLSEAIINFLMLIGWHPKPDREIISLDEAIKEFTIDRVQKAGGIFNPEKLDWYNSYYLKHLSIEELTDRVKPFLKTDWNNQPDKVKTILEIEKARLKNLAEFPEIAAYYFDLKPFNKSLLLWKESPANEAMKHLNACLNIIEETPIEIFDHLISEKIMEYANKEGRGNVLWPLRVALSGMEKSSGPLEIIKVIGRHETIQRIENALKVLA